MSVQEGQFSAPHIPLKACKTTCRKARPSLSAPHPHQRTGFSPAAPGSIPKEAERASSRAPEGLGATARRIPSQYPQRDSGGGGRVPPTRASGRAAVKHRPRLARSVLPLKRDIGGCGGVYPGGNAATAAGRPYSGPSASLQWGRKIKHKREANRIARSAAARVSLRSRARPQAGNAEWTRGPGRGKWRGRGVSEARESWAARSRPT